ncbi:hypothetical protein [Pontivivens insulae]|uniref:Uncharacterized protein n=1 Tax=Pontivivens insulae TaxID=1639689 RepID=A0A2R8ACX1_9RHOB|nr:hypothetical protein [Pontivivens insulae]RED14012.1 hypothetical protein DFR53_1363 [Pontivivens insulae]SPF30086.1 hypothetical protein POI8812_02416 [Pontivivens insulae]
MSDADSLSTPARARRRRYDGAALLPIFAAIMLLPPFVSLFAGSQTLFGIPVIVLWIFGIWLALIAIAARLSRLLINAPES